MKILFIIQLMTWSYIVTKYFSLGLVFLSLGPRSLAIDNWHLIFFHLVRLSILHLVTRCLSHGLTYLVLYCRLALSLGICPLSLGQSHLDINLWSLLSFCHLIFFLSNLIFVTWSYTVTKYLPLGLCQLVRVNWPLTYCLYLVFVT